MMPPIFTVQKKGEQGTTNPMSARLTVQVINLLQACGAEQKISQERLRKAFPNFNPDQVKPNTYSVTVSFRGTGLDVDVVPILYNGDPDWYGSLVSQDDGSLLKTCIPRHLEFIRKRKQAHETDFVQIARLVKFWANKMKREQDGFRSPGGIA
jgi:hypothetical protein